jgi:hypothetical protein
VLNKLVNAAPNPRNAVGHLGVTKIGAAILRVCERSKFGTFCYYDWGLTSDL